MAMVLVRQVLDMQFYRNRMNYSHLDHHIYGFPTIAEKPKLSICIVTFNHANFIKQCLDGILNQKINFEIEIIIGEDCSTDNTASLVREYAEKFPNFIKSFIRPLNVGAKTNFIHCFLSCRGDYIIYIEGDDYWTDTQKLQTQVDFLDSNPQASACFHNAEIVFEDGSGFAPQLINTPDQKKWVNSSDFLGEKETWFMATASVMMRTKFAQLLPDWFLESKSGDIPLYVILAEKGPIGYIDRIMSVYRKHEGGMSYTDNTQSEAFLNNRIFMYSKINEYTKFKYHLSIQNIIYEYLLQKIHSRKNQNTYFRKLYFFIKAIYFKKPNDWKHLKSLAKEHLLSSTTLLKYLNFRKKVNDLLRF